MRAFSCQETTHNAIKIQRIKEQQSIRVVHSSNNNKKVLDTWFDKRKLAFDLSNSNGIGKLVIVDNNSKNFSWWIGGENGIMCSTY